MNKFGKNGIVSVLTPTYNHEKYIGACIESVISQTYPNWEMIIIDDGSSDQTPEIVENYAIKDSRIHFIRQDNIGVFRLAETYNKALKISSGEYIAILEGDDFWLKDKLQRQMEAFKINPEAILCWGQRIATGNNDKLSDVYPVKGSPDFKYFTNNPVGSILNVLLFNNVIPAVTIMIKKESIEKIGGFQQNNGLPLVDLPTLYELSFMGKFVYIPSPLGIWRINPGQVSKVYTIQLAENLKSLAEMYFNKAKDLGILNWEITETYFKNFYKGQQIISYSRSGRYKMIRKEFRNARKDFLRSVFGFGFNKPIWKVRSIIGYLCSLFHFNIEGLSKFLR